MNNFFKDRSRKEFLLEAIGYKEFCSEYSES